MRNFLIVISFLLVVFLISCNQSTNNTSTFEVGKGALVTTHFKSFEEFKKVVQIEYSSDRKSWVRLTQVENGSSKVVSVLEAGVSELDIVKARDGDVWDKVWLSLRSPFFVSNRKDLQRVYVLSRRKQLVFGEGDIAFYDLAKTMTQNISHEDLAMMTPQDLSEKGYLNTFNHINAQAIMTTLFSEELADFVADVHERRNMPELISGKFRTEQIEDIENGPVDNYVDIVNNEWGQELGKQLRQKYKITRKTYWTTELLADFLNDLQAYYSWNFKIGFKPFRSEDELVIRFSTKINRVKESLKGL